MTVKKPPHSDSMRSRARPEALLVDLIEEPVLRFKNRLGSVIYDRDWVRISKSFPKGSNPEIVGSNAECLVIVEDQIIESLKIGVIKASVKLIVTLKKSVAEIEKDDGLPHLQKFHIFTDFWRSDASSGIDWSTGTIQINSLIHLQTASTYDFLTEDMSEIYEDLDMVQVPLFIDHPLVAISKVFILDQIPDSQWFERYIQYRAQGRMEAIAAGWRYLATVDPNAQSISAAALARIMSDYLQAQGFEPLSVSPRRETTQGLQLLAKHMLAQLEKRERNASVLVSSSKR